MSANSFILNTFLVAASNATRYASFSIVELDRSIKRKPIEIKDNADTICSLFIRECSDQISRKILNFSYPINSLESQPVILELTASAAFAKQKSIQNIILSNFTF